jgi:hypothetical protein
MKISYSYPEMILAISYDHFVKVMKELDASQIKFDTTKEAIF